MAKIAVKHNPNPIHPGEVLLEEFLKPKKLSQMQLAFHLGVSLTTVSHLINGKMGVSPRMAWKLAGAFGTTPEFWMNLQSAYNLQRARPTERTCRVNARRKPNINTLIERVVKQVLMRVL